MSEPLAGKVAWLQQRIDERANARKRKWERIKHEYPDHARMLEQVAAAFGKPEKVAMMDEKTGERIL